MARGRDPNLLAQQLLQGQRADIAPTTGFVPQPQLRPQQSAQAEALLAPQQAQPIRQELTTAAELLNPNAGRSIIAKNLLEFSNDRSRNPIARGLAAFVGSKTLIEEGERAGEQERRTTAAAAEAKAEQQRIAQGFKEREIGVQERKLDIDVQDLQRKRENTEKQQQLLNNLLGPTPTDSQISKNSIEQNITQGEKSSIEGLRNERKKLLPALTVPGAAEVAKAKISSIDEQIKFQRQLAKEKRKQD